MTTNPSSNTKISLEDEDYYYSNLRTRHHHHQQRNHHLLQHDEVGMGNARIDTNNSDWLHGSLLLGSSMSPLNRLHQSNEHALLLDDEQHAHDASLKKRPSTSSSSNGSSSMGTINKVDMMEMIMWCDLEPTPIGPQESIQVLPSSATPARPTHQDQHHRHHHEQRQQQLSQQDYSMDLSRLSPSLLECLRPLLLSTSPSSSDTCNNSSMKKRMTDHKLYQHKKRHNIDDIIKPITTPTLNHQISSSTTASRTTQTLVDATSDTESIASITHTDTNIGQISSSSTLATQATEMMALSTSRVIVKAAAEAAASRKKGKRFRMSQAEQWGERYKELIRFKEENGHCVVPLCYPINTTLSHWVKRQRCQYKLKHAGKRSTLTDDRETLLEELGFTWDSHNASWEERYHDLVKFKSINGHCNVPSSYPPNPSLAGWIKCQRRYVRMYYEHKERGNVPMNDDDGNAGDFKTSSSVLSFDGESTSTTGSEAAAQLKSTMRYSLNSERVKRLVDLGLRWKKFNAK